MKRKRRKRKNVMNELTRRLGCTIGTFRCTSPPPRGGAPRMTIFSSRSSTGTPNCLSSGRVVVRKVSTLGSLLSFVMPAINHFFLNTKTLHSGRRHPLTRANYTQKNRQCTWMNLRRRRRKLCHWSASHLWGRLTTVSCRTDPGQSGVPKSSQLHAQFHIHAQGVDPQPTSPVCTSISYLQNKHKASEKISLKIPKSLLHACLQAKEEEETNIVEEDITVAYNHIMQYMHHNEMYATLRNFRQTELNFRRKHIFQRKKPWYLFRWSPQCNRCWSSPTNEGKRLHSPANQGQSLGLESHRYVMSYRPKSRATNVVWNAVLLPTSPPPAALSQSPYFLLLLLLPVSFSSYSSKNQRQTT